MTMIDELLSEGLWGFLRAFQQNWNDGWRPVLHHDDLSFLSPLGSYVRSRRSEHGEELAFGMLSDWCEKNAK
jgi:hypothetical protein